MAATFGPQEVYRIAFETLGYPPGMVTTHKEAAQVLAALENERG